jgi:hypothetical protein
VVVGSGMAVAPRWERGRVGSADIGRDGWTRTDSSSPHYLGLVDGLLIQFLSVKRKTPPAVAGSSQHNRNLGSSLLVCPPFLQEI